MNKKTEYELLFISKFYFDTDSKDGIEAYLRLRRFGTRFIVEKSGFNGKYACHMNYYDNVEEAYADYSSFLNLHEGNLEHSR